MKFYTSDPHFYHANIIKYQARPFSNVNEMNEKLIANWNRRVTNGDEVYILGDLAFCNGTTANELLDRLNGRKYLIKGNHDSFLGYSNFDRTKLEWIKDYAKVDDHGTSVILFHYPIAVWDRQHHGSIHLYGHVHDNVATAHPLILNLENAYNVGVEVRDYEPKTLKEIMT